MGLAYVAPIGAQNIFVINSALTHNRRRALLTALIVIFFDVTLAWACFFGIGTLMSSSVILQLIIMFAGSLVVIWIGIGLIRSKGQDIEAQKGELSLKKTITKACVVTWFNPQAIIDGSMMLGAFNVSLIGAQKAAFIIGVSCASFCWFTGITLIISIFSNFFTAKVLRIINIVCGIIIIFYGAKLFYSFIVLLISTVSGI